MNVSCTSCSAKYAIPDEKVRGKKVKITCKHCGTGIIVDGTKLDAQAAAPAPAAPAAAPAPAPAKVAAAAPAASQSEALSFDIAYPDDRQETLPLAELADKYVAGTLTDEAFIWREGMPDWKAPLDIPEVAAAVAARGGKKPRAAAALGGDDEATKVQESPFEAQPANAGSGWREPAKEAPSSPAAAFDLRSPAALPLQKAEKSPSAPAAASPPPADVVKPAVAAVSASTAATKPAARRSAARGGGDLFGDLAGAGGEDDESLGTDVADPAPKLTGQRNESSVLFSLDALTKQEQKPADKKSTPKKDDDAAALLMGLDSAPSSLANVGNAFVGSAFAAPDFNAPVVAPPPELRASPAVGGVAPYEPKKGGAGKWLALIAVVVLGGGAAAMVLSGKLANISTAPAPSAPIAAQPADTAPAPTPTTEATTAPAESAGAATPSAAPATGGAAATAAPAGAPGTTPAAATPAATSPAPAAPGAAKPAEPAAKPAEPAKPADKPAEASNAPPFDTAAAKEALGAAAANAGSCKTADGPTGSGKVAVTFVPSGRATNTQVSGDLAGTAVGGCVARLFRNAKVPPFSGDAITVTKSFSVQ